MDFLKDKNLNICLVISASCHLFCMISISPIFLSGDIKTYSTKISFLGSILDTVVIAKERDFSLDVYPLAEERDAQSEDLKIREPKKDFFKSRPLSTEKEIPGIMGYKGEDILIHMAFEKDKERLRFRFKDMLVTGNAQNRLLIYKPDIADIGLPLYFFDRDYHVTVKFKISKHGLVEQPVCLVSSGSAYIDRFALRYIRGWQFTPSNEDFQEGVVRLNFGNTL
ncbi:MAG: TonB family protein [Candidatus Omnitrophota bacterium]